MTISSDGIRTIKVAAGMGPKVVLPGLHKKLKDFALYDRPFVEGRKRTFHLPFWEVWYDDYHWFKMAVGGRQIFKSTAFSDELAWAPLTVLNDGIGVNSLYCTYDMESRRIFSFDKFRKPVFQLNENMTKYIRGVDIGDVSHVQYVDGGNTYLITDERAFGHFEGKSPWLTILDEGHKLDITPESWTKMRESQATVQGPIRIGGVGGEQGSQYHIFWTTTDQRKWVFKGKGNETYKGFPGQKWREKLTRDCFNSDGLIWDEYLKDICAGIFEPQEPMNVSRHGYWFPQTIFPHIPLLEQDAIELYKTDREFSLEYKFNNYPMNALKQYVLGEFFAGVKRPVTPAMVEACMKPYPYLKFLSPEEVRQLKSIYGHDIVVLLGVDFGSGKKGSSKTVITIMIKWVARTEFNFPTPRYQVAFISDNPPTTSDEKAEYLRDLIVAYDVDVAIGDYGYGKDVIDLVQQGGRRRMTGQWYEGVNDKITGCWTRKDVAQFMGRKEETVDEEHDIEEHFLIDKTQSIDLFINMLQRYVYHPLESQREREWPPGTTKLNNHPWMYARPQIMIPYGIQRQVRWLIKDFTGIERADIEDEEMVKPDKRQQAHKEYTHPPDAVMSFIYCFVADANFDPQAYSID